MNIHINKELFEKLMDSVLFEIEIGSRMYGIEDEFSDHDKLLIYVPSDLEKNSFLFSHHQLQYKENGTDYVFTNLHNFIRNALNGDATINFEVINSDKLVGTPIQFLYDMRSAFNNYKIIRSYCGFGKRDLQQMEEKSTDRDKNKKLIHAYRCLKFAKTIYDNNFSLRFDGEEMELIKTIRSITNYQIRNNIKQGLMEKITNFRNLLNDELNKKRVVEFMSVENQIKLDSNLNFLMGCDTYQDIKMKDCDIDMILFYNAEEKGIEY